VFVVGTHVDDPSCPKDLAQNLLPAQRGSYKGNLWSNVFRTYSGSLFRVISKITFVLSSSELFNGGRSGCVEKGHTKSEFERFERLILTSYTGHSKSENNRTKHPKFLVLDGKMFDERTKKNPSFDGQRRCRFTRTGKMK
jgi:hypothetical protein